MPPRAPSVEVEANGRVLSLSVAWFSDGARRRASARHERRCVECGKELRSGRTPYCSRRCRWAFHGHYFWDSARHYVLLRDRYTCRACGHRQRARDLEVDHLVEISRGGAALEYSNLQALCRPCHRKKTQGFLSGRARGVPAVPSGKASPSVPAATADESPPGAQGCL
jgi:5-methylcytosine-specific restriction endonuclease McrA